MPWSKTHKGSFVAGPGWHSEQGRLVGVSKLAPSTIKWQSAGVHLVADIRVSPHSSKCLCSSIDSIAGRWDEYRKAGGEMVFNGL